MPNLDVSKEDECFSPLVYLDQYARSMGRRHFFPRANGVLRPQGMVLIEDGWVEEVGQPTIVILTFPPKGTVVYSM